MRGGRDWKCLLGCIFVAVSAVRLLRIHQGGAFVDLLNDKGDDSGEREMGYVERTLGFRTRPLDDRNVRLVRHFFTFLQFYLFNSQFDYIELWTF